MTKFSLRFLSAALAISMISGLAIGQEADDADRRASAKGTSSIQERPSEIMKPTVKQIDAATIEDIIDAVAVSEPHKGKGGKLISVPDVIEWEMEDLTRLLDPKTKIHGKTIPLSERGYDFERYGFNEAVADRLIAAKEAGLGQLIIQVDLNQSIDGGFKKGEEFHSRFLDGTKWKENGHAKAIQKLIAAGFEIASPGHTPTGKYVITSPPLYADDNVRDPLEHQKSSECYYLENGKRIALTFKVGSANGTERNARVNQITAFNSPELAQHELEHNQRFDKNYSEGNPIYKVDSLQPLQLVAKDGSHITIYHTDGKYELNDLYVQLLMRGIEAEDVKSGTYRPNNPRGKPLPPVNAADRLDILEIYSFNFVDTHAAAYEMEEAALRAGIRKNLGTTMFEIIDQKFSEAARDYNMTAARVGVPVVRGAVDPANPQFRQATVWPIDFSVRKLIDSNSYARTLPNRKITDPDGAPIDVYVFHVKTMIVKVRDAQGKVWWVEFEGTYNKSRNYHNAEIRTVTWYPENSQVPTEKVAYYKGLKESQGRYVRPTLETAIRQGIARMTDHIWAEIPLDAEDTYYNGKPEKYHMQMIMEAIRKGDFATVQEAIQALAERPTFMDKKHQLKDKEEVANRLKRLSTAIEWFANLKKGVDIDNARLYGEQFHALMSLITYAKNDSTYAADFLVDQIIYRKTKDMTPDEKAKAIERLEALKKELWAIAEVKSEFPKPRGETAPKEKETAPKEKAEKPVKEKTPRKRRTTKSEVVEVAAIKKPAKRAAPRARRTRSTGGGMCQGLFAPAS